MICKGGTPWPPLFCARNLLSTVSDNETPQLLVDLGSCLAKCTQPRFLITVRSGRIFETPMEAFRVRRKHWTLLVCVVAHSDDVIKVLAHELVHRLRVLLRDIDTDFTHHDDRFGPHLRWRHSRTLNFVAITCKVTEQTFRHLTTRRVAGAKDQDSFAFIHLKLTNGTAPFPQARRRVGPQRKPVRQRV